MFLSLDLPPPPLFQDERNIIPQVPLFELLNKFDGVTEKVRCMRTEWSEW